MIFGKGKDAAPAVESFEAIDLGALVSLLEAGQNQYRAFKDAKEAIEVLASRTNYAAELEARIAQVKKDQAEAEELYNQLADLITARHAEAAKIVADAQEKAQEILGKATADAEAKATEMLCMPTMELAAIKADIAIASESLGKLVTEVVALTEKRDTLDSHIAAARSALGA